MIGLIGNESWPVVVPGKEWGPLTFEENMVEELRFEDAAYLRDKIIDIKKDYKIKAQHFSVINN